MRVGSMFEELDVCSASASEVSVLLHQVINVPEVSLFKG